MSSRSELNKVYEFSNGRKRYEIYWEGPDEYRLCVVEGGVTQQVEKTHLTLDEALRALRDLLDAP